MGSICSIPSELSESHYLKPTQYHTTDDISISPRLFVKQNSNAFLSVYHICEFPIGLGSVGEVWVCQHLRSHEKRAVKIISKKILSKDEILNKSVLNEVDIIRSLDHPCILRIYEYFEDKFNYYIVMEYCPGGDLFEKLESVKKFSEEQVAKVMQQVFSVLFYMHTKKIIHRDIKLENILIVDEENLMIKVIDFNIAVFNKANSKLSKMTGTPSYMAPEVIRGCYTDKCDLWSCGVLLYVLISGEFPFDAEFHDQLLAKILEAKFSLQDCVWGTVSVELKKLLMQLLQKDPEKRITAEAALKDLWMHKSYKSNVEEKTIVKTLRRLKTMPKVSKIQEVFQTFMIAQITKHDTEIIKLKQVFENFDKDKNGVISKEELINLLKTDMSAEEARIKAERVLQVIDNDHSGGIDFTEFLRVTIKEKSMLSEENVRKAFFYFDQDRSERIEKEELLEWLNEGGNIPPDIAEELMNEADCNGDGVIDIEEFQQVLLRKLEITE